MPCLYIQKLVRLSLELHPQPIHIPSIPIPIPIPTPTPTPKTKRTSAEAIQTNILTYLPTHLPYPPHLPLPI